MTKKTHPCLGIVAAALFTAAAPAAAQNPSDSAINGTYYWLHPKLGQVKVDRTTHAMVPSARPPRQHEDAGTQREEARLWLDPKGNFRVVKVPSRVVPNGAPLKSHP